MEASAKTGENVELVNIHIYVYRVDLKLITDLLMSEDAFI